MRGRAAVTCACSIAGRALGRRPHARARHMSDEVQRVGVAKHADDQTSLADNRELSHAAQTDRRKGVAQAFALVCSDDGKTLVPYEPEQATRFVTRDLRLRGFKLREIAEELRQIGIVGRTGRPLGITRIYELLDEGEGSQRRVLMKRSRAVEDEDQPLESSVVERFPSTAPGKQRSGGPSRK